MPSASAVLFSVVLVTGLSLPGQGKWKPLYDYTNLQPSNEAYWKPLQQAQVQMEQALELAAQTEGASIHPLSATLKDGEGGAAWDLQVFVGNDRAAPKRVNLQIATAEPKVLRRLELLSLTEEDKKVWPLLLKTRVAADAAIEICKDHSSGNRPQPVIRDPRLRTLAFVPEEDAPIWECELMGDDWKKEEVRRYQFHVNAQKPGVKRRILLDRFAGEPLRDGQPTELPNGMFVYDFIVGEGDEVTAESKVRTNYRLFLIDNTKLHDTWDTKRPETFELAKAPLKGMTEGMVGMRVGGKRKIVIPYPLAFGEAGNDLAPPRAMVVCDVAIMGVVQQ
jgi:FKBP-type peptidyl-prolyl cis-trans isomerase